MKFRITSAFLIVWTSVASAASDRDLFSPPAVRPPTALIADAGENSVRLEWNANLDENLAGYYLYRADGNVFRRITPKALSAIEFTDHGVKNGTPARYRVSAVLKNGVESPPSNLAEATPRPVQAPVIVQGSATVSVPGFDPINVAQALSILFENSNRIVFDKRLGRVRDWQAADGTHLLYPRPYGNPIDITQMDNSGFPVPRPATDDRPALPPALTLPYAGVAPGRTEAWWVRNGAQWDGFTVDGNRVTLEYHIPITGYRIPESTPGVYRGWATIWETWSPVERVMPGGTRYAGLARKIELDLPSSYDEGYSLCLNDGFGVNGSCDGAVTYEPKWEKFIETHWQKSNDFHSAPELPPRQTQGYHPSEFATQTFPFQFARFPQGALILAPRHYYYSTSYSWANYVAHGRDGLWPNYAIDAAAAGTRARIETFEYLWCPDPSLQPPQQYIDASFYYRRGLARLYGLQLNHTTLDHAWDAGWGPGPVAVRGLTELKSLDVMRQWFADTAKRAKMVGADELGGAHQLWTSSPYTVPDSIRLNPDHPVNRAIADAIASVRKQGLGFAYWLRPEFVKQPYPIAISTHFYTDYYGYVDQLFPPALPIVQTNGLALIRQHPDWIRLNRDGSHPLRTPYDWTPMSLTKKGWYEQVIYPDLVMMKELGATTVFQDGGSSSLAGVDYSSGAARPVQPYYWRYYQDLYALGLNLDGECPVGWVSSNFGNQTKFNTLWAFSMANFRGNLNGGRRSSFTAAMRHTAHQLYSGVYLSMMSDSAHTTVARFAQKFLADHGHPDRVFLEGLRYESAKRTWVWDNVWWEYADGKRVRYPNYDEIGKVAAD